MTQRVTLSVDFGQGLTNAWDSIVTIVPKLIAFVVILFVGWMIAKFIAKILDRLLRKIGFEKVAEKGGMSQVLKGSAYDTTGIISKVVYYAIMLMTLQLGFGVFGPNPISTMLQSIVAWLPRGLVAIVIVVVAMAVARAARDIITGALGTASYGKALGTIAWVFIIAMGAFAALGQAGIATSVTQPLLIAILATIAGVVIVGAGGGLITPMRARWDRWLDVAERETAKARADVSAYQKGRADATAGQPAVTQTASAAAAYGRESGTTS